MRAEVFLAPVAPTQTTATHFPPTAFEPILNEFFHNHDDHEAHNQKLPGRGIMAYPTGFNLAFEASPTSEVYVTSHVNYYAKWRTMVYTTKTADMKHPPTVCRSVCVVC
ncbi:hypothetical protein HPB52_010905 [Rhipicephalus sanguineus]|uniref:Uncharacterized protein n=1 Tax=Rhipicephalus sanguineus TaxID=34632 RepID=A0A9D4SNF9_RHISA|nr:hypothetical protein HPB52_010905 [Rhipicephalus sanguineus]